MAAIKTSKVLVDLSMTTQSGLAELLMQELHQVLQLGGYLSPTCACFSQAFTELHAMLLSQNAGWHASTPAYVFKTASWHTMSPAVVLEM